MHSHMIYLLTMLEQGNMLEDKFKHSQKEVHVTMHAILLVIGSSRRIGQKAVKGYIGMEYLDLCIFLKIPIFVD